jgi:hypothetical protein
VNLDNDNGSGDDGHSVVYGVDYLHPTVIPLVIFALFSLFGVYYSKKK